MKKKICDKLNFFSALCESNFKVIASLPFSFCYPEKILYFFSLLKPLRREGKMMIEVG